MARETIYLVQGFVEMRGVLKAEPAMRCKSEDAAKRAALRLGETKDGAVAFSSSGDAELGDFDEEPVILTVVGRVPEFSRYDATIGSPTFIDDAPLLATCNARMRPHLRFSN